MDWADISNPEKQFHEKRKGTIGSSDMPIIMGVSPYKTAIDLWEIKTGISNPEPQNYAQARGTEMEPVARDWFNKRMLKTFKPINFYHTSIPQFTASLDGWHEKTREAVEIKFPGKEDHGYAKQGKIPEHYLVQVHWQYIVSNADVIYYLSYKSDNDAFIIQAPKPTEEEKTKLVQAASEFLDLVKSKTKPKPSMRDYVEALSDENKTLVDMYIDKHAQITKLEEELSVIRNKIIVDAIEKKHNKLSYGKLTVVKTTKEGRIDYKSIKELEGVDLDKYKSASKEVYTVRVKDED